MLDFAIGTKGLTQFAKALNKGHRSSLSKAFQGEAFRLSKMTAKQMRSGTGYPKRSPLANLLAGRRDGRGAKRDGFGGRIAFKWAASAVKFVTKKEGKGFSATIGPSVRGGKKKGVNPAYLEGNIKGRSMKITRERQQRIAAMLKKAYPNKGRKFIRTKVPRLGTHPTPKRSYIDQVERREGGEKSTKNIAALYELAQRGERWAKTWWVTK
jgi:hypothetical protein